MTASSGPEPIFPLRAASSDTASSQFVIFEAADNRRNDTFAGTRPAAVPGSCITRATASFILPARSALVASCDMLEGSVESQLCVDGLRHAESQLCGGLSVETVLGEVLFGLDGPVLLDGFVMK
jgi:hypothetical protein